MRTFPMPSFSIADTLPNLASQYQSQKADIQKELINLLPYLQKCEPYFGYAGEKYLKVNTQILMGNAELTKQ